MKPKLSNMAIALRILCATLLLSLAFAHKPFSVESAAAAELAAYVLPDGSVSSLCTPGDEGKLPMVADHGCEACRLVAGTILPAPVIAAGEPLRFTEPVRFQRAADPVHDITFPPSAPPRGPPLLISLTA